MYASTVWRNYCSMQPLYQMSTKSPWTLVTYHPGLTFQFNQATVSLKNASPPNGRYISGCPTLFKDLAETRRRRGWGPTGSPPRLLAKNPRLMLLPSQLVCVPAAGYRADITIVAQSHILLIRGVSRTSHEGTQGRL